MAVTYRRPPWLTGSYHLFTPGSTSSRTHTLQEIEMLKAELGARPLVRGQPPRVEQNNVMDG
jgi:hypothetical protein